MDIIVSGSIAYDYLMRFPGRFAEHVLMDHLQRISVSFLVEDMTKHWGGNGGNIAYTMALLGERPKLFGTVGKDFDPYHAWLDSVGVDLSTVKRIDDVYVASFFANTDLDNNQIGSFYSGAMSYAKQFRIADVYSGTPDLMIISPNDPIAMSQYCAECRERGIKFVYDPSQQVARLNGDDLRTSMEGAYMLVVNEYEIMMIGSKTGLSLDQIRDMIPVLIVTHGKDGSRIYTEGQCIEVPIFECTEVKEPTGVGDAYRAGLLTGLSHGFPLKLCGEMGALCATYALEHVGTQNHHFTPAEFVARFRTQFDDGGLLDQLLA
ncbi:MAG: carbohydrate kinase family protein [Anaerolineae bacterium]